MKWVDDLTRFVFLDDPPTKSDIIFIPGNAHAEPSEKAARLYHEGYAPLLLPSGRYSILSQTFPGQISGRKNYSGRFFTEWDFMHHILVSNGVPSEAILQENQATYTYQNALFSRKITDQLHLSVKKALIVCLPVHARRAYMYYETLFPDAEIRVCPVEDASITAKNWYFSNEGIDRVLGEIERCGSQFHDILWNLKEKEKGRD